MADLHSVDFALIPNPVKKEKQFSLPDDFSEIDFTDSLTDEPLRVRSSRAFHGQTAVRRSALERHGARSKKFQHFRSLR